VLKQLEARAMPGTELGIEEEVPDFAAISLSATGQQCSWMQKTINLLNRFSSSGHLKSRQILQAVCRRPPKPSLSRPPKGWSSLMSRSYPRQRLTDTRWQVFTRSECSKKAAQKTRFDFLSKMIVWIKREDGKQERWTRSGYHLVHLTETGHV